MHKLDALKEAFKRMAVLVDVEAIAAKSEIDVQPFGFEEIYRGAFNRAKNAQLERPGSTGIGIENGIVSIGNKFIDLAIVVVVTPDGKNLIGTSTGVEFPKEAVELAKSRGFENTTVGSVIAETSGGSETDPHSTLTHGRLSRKEILIEAIVAVLSQSLPQ